MNAYDAAAEKAQRAAHFAEAVPDRETKLAGRRFRSHDGGTFELVSHHSCGYHMRPLDANSKIHPGEWRCISERAIDATWFEIRGDHA